MAYQSAVRLGAFVTEVYVHRPRRLRPFGVVPFKGLARGARRLSAYHHAGLSDKVLIATRSSFDSVIWRLLGARRFLRADTGWVDAIAQLCIEKGWACHMGRTHAVEVFKSLRESGLPCILEQYSTHPRLGRELLSEEYARRGLPFDENTAESLGMSMRLIERNESELALADAVMVPSDFARQSVIDRGVAPQSAHLVAYGASVDAFGHRMTLRRDDEPLNVAFVGALNLNKGILYLLEAVRSLGANAAHVHAFGHLSVPEKLIEPYRAWMTLHGHVPRDVLAEKLAHCHACALLSLWEGSAVSTFECLASGLPAVVTENAGSVVRDGIDGFIVPACHSESVAESLVKLRDEKRRQEMSRSAAGRAGEYSWTGYHRNLCRSLGLASDAPQSR